MKRTPRGAVSPLSENYSKGQKFQMCPHIVLWTDATCELWYGRGMEQGRSDHRQRFASPPPGITLWLPPAASVLVHMSFVPPPLLTMHKFPPHRFRILILICLWHSDVQGIPFGRGTLFVDIKLKV